MKLLLKTFKTSTMNTIICICIYIYIYICNKVIWWFALLKISPTCTIYIFLTLVVSWKHIICGVQMRSTTPRLNYRKRTAPTKNGLNIPLLTQINLFLLVFLLLKWLRLVLPVLPIRLKNPHYIFYFAKLIVITNYGWKKKFRKYTEP